MYVGHVAVSRAVPAHVTSQHSVPASVNKTIPLMTLQRGANAHVSTATAPSNFNKHTPLLWVRANIIEEWWNQLVSASTGAVPVK